MKSAVVYYTFGGSTEKEAERIAAGLGADRFCVREAKKRSLLGAFIPGGLQAMMRKSVEIAPVKFDLSAYDRVCLCCPVWAAYPAPAFNAMLALLPAGKEVEVFLCSGGGAARASDAQTRRLIEARGCTVIAIHSIATGTAPGKQKEA